MRRARSNCLYIGLALGRRGQADLFNPALAGMLAEDGSIPHANGHHFSNLLRAKIRKTERDEKDAVDELVSTASGRF